MLKNFLNKVAGSKIFCIVFSILVAIALWFYIDLVENPEVSVEVENIPLTFTGQEILESRNLMLSEGANQTISLEIYGKRTVVSRLNSNNITAYIDLSSVLSPGENNRGYDLIFPDWVDTDAISVVGWSPRNVSYSIIQRSSREITVEGKLVGAVADGYQMASINCSPNRISVTGPDEIINRIARAEARLVRDEVTQSISANTGFVLLDAEGEEIPTDGLSLSVNEVAVELNILTVKSVPLFVDVIEGGGATAKDAVIQIEPQVIDISGDAATLADITRLSVGTVDLSKFSLSQEQDMSIILPENVNNVTGITSAKVTVEISSDFELKRILATNIQLANAEGLDAEIVTESVDVTVRAKRDILEEIDASNVRIVVDLTDMSETKGLVPIKARVYVDGYSAAGAIGEYSVTIRLN